MTVPPEAAAEPVDLTGTVDLVDEAARSQARLRLHAALGQDSDPGVLGALAVWWSGVRGACPAPAPARVRLLVVGGERPDAAEHADAAARSAVGATAEVLVVGAAGGAGSDAPASADAAARLGQQVSDREADAGTDLLVVAGTDDEAGAAAAGAVVAALLAREPAEVCGVRARGGRMDDAGWMRAVAAVRDQLRAVRRQAPGQEPWEVVRALDARDVAALAGLVGVVHQAAVRRTPVLLDGTLACTAALVAARLDPAVAEWLLAAVRPSDVAARLALDAVDLPPAVDLAGRLGPGTATLAAVPLLRLAAELLASPDGVG